MARCRPASSLFKFIPFLPFFRYRAYPKVGFFGNNKMHTHTHRRKGLFKMSPLYHTITLPSSDQQCSRCGVVQQDNDSRHPKQRTWCGHLLE